MRFKFMIMSCEKCLLRITNLNQLMYYIKNLMYYIPKEFNVLYKEFNVLYKEFYVFLKVCIYYIT